MAAFLKISICLSALLPIEQSAWSKGLTGIMLAKFLKNILLTMSLSKTTCVWS